MCPCVFCTLDFLQHQNQTAREGRTGKQRTLVPKGPLPPGTTIQCLSSLRPQPHFHQLICLQSWACNTSCSKSEQKPAGLSSELGCLSRSDLLSAIGRLPSVPHPFCQMKKTWIQTPFIPKKKMDFLESKQIHCRY